MHASSDGTFNLLTTHPQLCKYLLLYEYANLRVKGIKMMEASTILARIHHEGAGIWFARQICSLARFYQKFEQLLPELRGGIRQGVTHLEDTDVQHTAKKWLGEQKLGTVTLTTFRNALNKYILPGLNIRLNKPHALHSGGLSSSVIIVLSSKRACTSMAMIGKMLLSIGIKCSCPKCTNMNVG